MTDVRASAANSLMQSAQHVTTNVHIPVYITNCLESLNACSHSYLHLNTLATGYGDFRVCLRVDGRGGWFCCVLVFVVI